MRSEKRPPRRAPWSLEWVAAVLAWAAVPAWPAVLAGLAEATVLVVPAAAESHPFSAADLVTMARISGVEASPDGTQVVYVLRSTDLAADEGRTDLWLATVDFAKWGRSS